jgi:hypothetical protein
VRKIRPSVLVKPMACDSSAMAFAKELIVSLLGIYWWNFLYRVRTCASRPTA